MSWSGVVFATAGKLRLGLAARTRKAAAVTVSSWRTMRGR
jgi:hypothetical protein